MVRWVYTQAMTSWMLVDVVSGDFRIRCDDCGSICRSRYEVIRHRQTGDVRHVGTDCGFKRTGTHQPTIVKVDDGPQEIGEMPDWMM